MTYPDFIEQWRDSSSHILCNTSGSTGQPKEIQLPKVKMAESARRTIDFFGLDSRSHLHSCISPDYIGGKMMAVRAELTGATLTYEKPSNRPLSHYRGPAIDLLATVPSQMHHILENKGSMPVINNIIIGGSRIPEGLRQDIASSGLNAFETYGMTETASHIALRKISPEIHMFQPLPGITVSTDAESRLVIEMKDWQTLVTNDMVHLDKNGGFEILGRYDNVIITGGKKVHPEKVEGILEKEFKCDALITSEPDGKWGERVILVIEDNVNPVSDELIMSYCRTNLPEECVPKIIRHEVIERTHNGKKKRK